MARGVCGFVHQPYAVTSSQLLQPLDFSFTMPKVTSAPCISGSQLIGHAQFLHLLRTKWALQGWSLRMTAACCS